MLIVKYTPDWRKHFTDLKREIDRELAGLAYRIEHVGSTSVPGLDAKPIIDIDIIFADSAAFPKIKSGLIALGYFHNGDQGIVGREVFKRDGNSTNHLLDAIPHHLYVCAQGSPPLERHILMRNYLRKNEWARVKYQELKYELAEKAGQDRKVYAELKEQYANDFIDEIIEKEILTLRT
ncbi:MAG: GrpB family protein, partial [Bacteroidota bacterium]